jgi:hypothetical protein
MINNLYQFSTPSVLKYYTSEFIFTHDKFEEIVEEILAEYLKVVIPLVKEEEKSDKFAFPQTPSTILNSLLHEEIFDEKMKERGFKIATNIFQAAYYTDPGWVYEDDNYIMNKDLKEILYTDDLTSA